ncbi:45138_t:CDS:2 [Gigaspora margarita]|uniref:45138_t:CDS:1 n=1 Tax=Gigaspora margarita TaxID=4874 RepID=A0ABM8W2T8_GIGMA|nr:45138_t:CDS:2 [Gigaspora margarita]
MPFGSEKGASVLGDNDKHIHLGGVQQNIKYELHKFTKMEHWWVRNSWSTTPIHRSNYKFVECNLCNLYGKVALDMGQIANRPDPVNIEPRVGHTAHQILITQSYGCNQISSYLKFVLLDVKSEPFIIQLSQIFCYYTNAICGEKGASVLGDNDKHIYLGGVQQNIRYELHKFTKMEHWWVRNSRSTTPIHRSNYKFIECNLYGKVALDMGQASVKRSLTYFTHYNDLCTLCSDLKFGISNLDIANRPDPVNIEPRVGHTAVLVPDNYNAKLWISSATSRMPFGGEKGASVLGDNDKLIYLGGVQQNIRYELHKFTKMEHWWVRNSRSTTLIHRSNYKFIECNLYGKVALDMGKRVSSIANRPDPVNIEPRVGHTVLAPDNYNAKLWM